MEGSQRRPACTNDTSYTYGMENTKERSPQPLRAILSRKNLKIICTLVFEDEGVRYPQPESLSIRGAQREITGALVQVGYVPAGRWSEEEEEDEDGYREWTRPFKPGPDASPNIRDIWPQSSI
jgi:hypothetical protein